MKFPIRAALVGTAILLISPTIWAAKKNWAKTFAYYTILETKVTSVQDGTEAHFKKHCPFGTPRKLDAWTDGDTVYVSHKGYALEYSSEWKFPVWTCEKIEKSILLGDAKRKNNYAPDPFLVAPFRAELTDYAGSGYHRGHLVPAENKAGDQALMDQTFYLSNMAAQKGSFNTGIWKALENRVRKWGKQRGVIFVIAGGMLYDPDEEDPSTADGYVEYQIIGEGQVAVPTHFYKIIVGKNADGKWESISFVFANKKYSNYQLSDYRRSIDWVEDRTALNFLPDLDISNSNLANALESSINQMW